MSQSISLEELLAEFERLGINAVQNDEGLTSAEYSEMWKVSRPKTCELLNKLKAAGALETGRREMTRLDGKTTYAPVYRITAGPKAKGKQK